MTEEEIQRLKDKITRLEHQHDLNMQSQKFWRWIIIGAAGLSNTDIALTILKGAIL